MKKAKLMLIGLICFAFIGTSFARKSKRFTTHFIYTGILHSGVCTTELDGAGVVCGHTPVVSGSCTPLTSNCPDVYTVAIND